VLQLDRVPRFSATMRKPKLVSTVQFMVDSKQTTDTFVDIGTITSGIPSPTLGTNIAMGYVKNGYHKKGTQLKVKVRRNVRDAVVKGMPFVPAKYYR
jgi:glycine cleavage system aminomethyltransferase T